MAIFNVKVAIASMIWDPSKSRELEEFEVLQLFGTALILTISHGGVMHKNFSVACLTLALGAAVAGAQTTQNDEARDGNEASADETEDQQEAPQEIQAPAPAKRAVPRAFRVTRPGVTSAAPNEEKSASETNREKTMPFNPNEVVVGPINPVRNVTPFTTVKDHYEESDYIPGTRSLKGSENAKPGSSVAGNVRWGDLGAFDHHLPIDIMLSQGKTLAEISAATGQTGYMLLSFIPRGYTPGVKTYLSKDPSWSKQPSGYDGSKLPVAPWAKAQLEYEKRVERWYATGTQGDAPAPPEMSKAYSDYLREYRAIIKR